MSQMTTSEERRAQSERAVAMLQAGRTTAQIAAALGVSHGTAYTRARPEVHRVYQAKRKIEFPLDQRLMLLSKADTDAILDEAVQLEEQTEKANRWRKAARRRTSVGSQEREAAIERLLDNLSAAQRPVTGHTRRAVWARWPDQYPHIARLRAASKSAQEARVRLLNMRATATRYHRSHDAAAPASAV